ncbi:MAG: glycosyltransferase family 2 protein [Bacteroidales bacterium]|nr:glycosyltransferase family 2 protein [Bacteroidales bacterium]
MLITIFWILVGIILYTYFGYTALLLLLNGFKFIFRIEKRYPYKPELLPEVTLLIAAYNEIDIVEKKMRNTGDINYPKDRLKVLWVTDGSDDGTPEKLATFKNISVLHRIEREGKTAALNRAMQHVNTPYVIFCDANAMLASNSVHELLSHFADPKVGCVAGEKRIIRSASGLASGTGEGIYWKYESFIKKLESWFYSTLGAAGELYAIRTELFSPIDTDFIVDDFVNSLKIALKGYKIKYTPNAYATEYPSFNIKEELKRKIRIATGGFQTIAKIPSLLNIFKHGLLSFEFISHKVLRWTVVPISLPAILCINIAICNNSGWSSGLFNSILILQSIFYFISIFGFWMEKLSLRLKILYLPYYLCMMNYAQMAGFIRFLNRSQTVVWEKARRR